MACVAFLKALLARCLFAIHGIITIWRVTEVNSEMIYYLLVIPVCLLPVEMIITLKFADDGEWKWFCPSVLLYLVSTVPGLWLLQFDLYEKRVAYRDSMGWTDCSSDTAYNSTALSSDIAGFQISIPVALSDDSWALGLEQFLLALLIVGRWLLPKGSLTRDQLSQLLLVYIGMAADILEFSLESLKEKVVICNLLLIIIILGLWSWSLLQFTLVLTSVSAPRPRAAKVSGGRSCKGVLGCCSNEIWALCITILMQDGPFLAMRLYLLIYHKVINQMMLFFTIKNVLVILLQLYRMVVVCLGESTSTVGTEDELLEAADEKSNTQRPARGQWPVLTPAEG
ncbi:transmembrane protein 26-like [Acanthaster planci]|uniref:Transmembrane protein 26-like n=1 Tax=Acanthaster planci TaxID=133434 RepID=A0A8B7YXZ4_ACAPL|nr:transmembrane protein 26-like [Acanthaster planci]